MRMVSFVCAIVAAFWAQSAQAEPVALTCTITNTSAYSVYQGVVSRARYNPDGDQTFSVDIDRHTITFAQQQLPIFVSDGTVVAIQHITGERPIDGTYQFDRRIGRYQVFLHLLIDTVPISVVYAGQCQTAAGAASF